MDTNSSLQLSQTTIYKQSTGCPEPYLRQIAEKGFTHIHWSHQWYTDFLYASPEIIQIKRWLAEFGLQVLDIHASAGIEKRWDSSEPYRRLAGVALVRNRLELAAQLGADAIVLHAESSMPLESQLKSLHELEPYACLLGVCICVENFADTASHIRLERLFEEFPPDVLGLCYDTGHGNMNDQGLDFLDVNKERLRVLHIHDNDGTSDQHKLPFTGDVDWERFAGLLAVSAYTGPVNLECMMSNHDGINETEFLQAAYIAGSRLEAMRCARKK